MTERNLPELVLHPAAGTAPFTLPVVEIQPCQLQHASQQSLTRVLCRIIRKPPLTIYFLTMKNCPLSRLQESPRLSKAANILPIHSKRHGTRAKLHSTTTAHSPVKGGLPISSYSQHLPAMSAVSLIPIIYLQLGTIIMCFLTRTQLDGKMVISFLPSPPRPCCLNSWLICLR